MHCASIGLFLTISHHPELGGAVVNGYGDKVGTAHRRGSQTILLLLLTAFNKETFSISPLSILTTQRSKYEIFDLRMLQFVVSTSIFDDAHIPSVWHSLLFPKLWFSAGYCSGAGCTYCQNSISHTDRGVWTKSRMWIWNRSLLLVLTC